MIEHGVDFMTKKADPRGIGVDGHVYLARCDDFPDCVKIGYTNGSPEKRVAMLQGEYGTMTPFSLIRSWACRSPFIIEQITHETFCHSHVYREIYSLGNCDLDDVVEDIEKTLRAFGAAIRSE